MSLFELGGLVAAPYTPFESDGSLRLGMIERLASSLIEAGIKGAFVCGTTGEGLSMTTAERMQVAERWIKVCCGTPLKVVVHVGHNSQEDAQALARHAGQQGAHAIAALPPFFFKPTSIDLIAQFMAPIAQAAESVPFYYYHIPSMTGVSGSMVDLLQVGSERIPNLRGIKFTHGDLMDYQRCLRVAGSDFEIAWGVDEMLLGALAIGAKSAVGSTYNYAGPLYQKMITAYRRNEIEQARTCAERSVEMISVLLKHGVLRTGKATMAMIGLDCGPTRLPVSPLNPEELDTVRRSYERMGFFDWSANRAAVTVKP